MTRYRTILVNLPIDSSTGGESETFVTMKAAMDFAEKEKHNWDMIHVNKLDKGKGHKKIAEYLRGKRVE